VSGDEEPPTWQLHESTRYDVPRTPEVLERYREVAATISRG